MPERSLKDIALELLSRYDKAKREVLVEFGGPGMHESLDQLADEVLSYAREIQEASRA